MYEKKQKPMTSPQLSRATAPTAVGSAGLSNSALTAMLLPGEERSGFLRPELEARFNAPLAQSALERQIPAAENEADRLSEGVGASSSPEAVKAAMGERLGADLSGVEFHTDAASAGRADAMGARAYTSGTDVYFGSGGFDPTIAAHELVHTVQQGAVSGGMQTVSAPASAVQMWPWSKKKKKEAAIPKQLDFGSMHQLKAGLDPTDDSAASVARVQGAGEEAGQAAVVKTNVDPDFEQTMSLYLREAGRTYDEKEPGKWHFTAPQARPLTAKETTAARPLVQSGKLHSTKAGTDPEEELKHMAAFTFAGGKSRVDPENYSEREWAELLEKDPDPILANPTGKKEKADYQRMMGYISMMDTVVGNRDRLVGAFNYENWLEDRDARQVNLIDNDFKGPAAFSNGTDGRSAWLGQLIGQTTVQTGRPHSGPVNEDYDKAGVMIRNMAGDVGGDDFLPVAGVLGYDRKNRDAQTGVQQAVKDLPGMRDRLKAQFYEANKQGGGSGDFTATQAELLERMQIAYEYMSDPQMAAIYRQLSTIGFATPHKYTAAGELTDEEKEESDDVKRLRADLLAQRDALRYGGNTGGARPTATSGPGWTKGTAQDWMNAGRPAAPAPASAPVIGGQRKRRKPLDTSLD